MRTPRFWYKNSPSLCSALLAPLAGLYARAATAHRESGTPRSVSLPVICLGNLVAGGSGKTPTAIALLELLRQRKIFLSPAFLTRGYRGKIRTAERVDESHDPALWGDEALILHRHAPTFVSPDRYLGAMQIQESGCDGIIMDDGLQNYSLNKDISFAIIDGMMGFGNGRVIPAGPLRQTLNEGYELTDAFILIGDDTRNLKASLPADKPVFTAKLNLVKDFTLPTNVPYIAFCGIGFPDKFKATLEKSGAKLLGWHAFADHHAYTMPQLESLVNEALGKNARLITTEKDFARLPDFTKKTLIDVLPVEINFDDPDKIAAFISARIASKQAS
jgi:tetraacyldisaccharide 4'-kinase